MDFYTAEEFSKFLSTARQRAKDAEEKGDYHEWHYYVFFAIAFYARLRKGEIHGLQWDDIKDGFLSVRRSVAQKLKGDDRITAPKNKTSNRTLQIPMPLINILTEHKELCKSIDGFNCHREFVEQIGL